MEVISYLLGKKSSGGGGGGGGDINKYFNTTIDFDTSYGNAFSDKIVKKFPTFTIADGITSLSYAFSETFYNSMDFEGLDCSNITNMSYLFYNNQKLETLKLKNIKNISSNTNITYMFSTNAKLKELTNMFHLTGNFNCTGVFYSCPAIKKIDLSNWNINVTTVTLMFYNVQKLAVIDVSNMTFPNNMSGAFVNCGNNCLQSDGAYADGIPYVYVKDATEQTKILSSAPSGWTSNNVVVKSN